MDATEHISELGNGREGIVLFEKSGLVGDDDLVHGKELIGAIDHVNASKIERATW